MPSTVRGNEYPTCHNFHKGFSCARTPCPHAQRCNKPGCGGITPGSGALLPLNQKSSHLHGLGSPTMSTVAPATVASNFRSVITPVNVFNLQCALHSNPDRIFVNKLCLELREGARIGFSGPRQFRFSRNLPNASLNPVSAIGLVPKKHSDNNFICPSPKQGPPVKTILSTRMIFSLQYITIDKAISPIQRFGSDCFMAKPT